MKHVAILVNKTCLHPCTDTACARDVDLLEDNLIGAAAPTSKNQACLLNADPKQEVLGSFIQ